MKQLKIACLVPIPEDPTSWYRGIGPLAALKKVRPDIELVFPNPVNWASLKLADIVFLQRPAMPEHFACVCMAKDLGLPVWVDFDDDNLSVPKDNPTYHLYNQMQVKDSIVKIARYADIITVSTKTIAHKYGIYNQNVRVVPNALDDSIMHLRTLAQRPREKSILWRGTATHTRNLKTIQNEVIELANRHPDWRWVFFGCDPIDITDHVRNHQVIPQMPILEFYKMMANIHATALYYCLADNDHSQSRSHVSWLEATFGGIMTYASKNAEFTRPGIINFSDPKAFVEHMEVLMSGGMDTQKAVEESWKEIQEKYMLSVVNRQRSHVVDDLAGLIK